MSNSQAIGVAYADPALNSFEVGTATVPIGSTVSGNLNQVYAKPPTRRATSAATTVVLSLLALALVKPCGRCLA